MRLILQRVSSASVRVDGVVISSIAAGLLVLVGIEKGDGTAEVEKSASKLSELRIFEDENGKMNLNLIETDGSCLVVSQFTLAGSLRKGRRPSFERAAPPTRAEPLVNLFVERLRSKGVPVSTGVFGARMEVVLVNDGPATFVLDCHPNSEIATKS